MAASRAAQSSCMELRQLSSKAVLGGGGVLPERTQMLVSPGRKPGFVTLWKRHLHGSCFNLDRILKNSVVLCARMCQRSS